MDHTAISLEFVSILLNIVLLVVIAGMIVALVWSKSIIVFQGELNEDLSNENARLLREKMEEMI